MCTVCFFLPLKRDKNVWHLRAISSVWRPLAFLPATLSLGSTDDVLFQFLIIPDLSGPDFHPDSAPLPVLKLWALPTNCPFPAPLFSTFPVSWTFSSHLCLKEHLDEGERGEWKTGLKLNTEKIKIMASGPVPSVICSVVSDSLWLHRLWPSSSSVHGILQARILEWVAIFFSRGSSQPRDWTWISSIAGRFLTIWATREAPTSWQI